MRLSTPLSLIVLALSHMLTWAWSNYFLPKVLFIYLNPLASEDTRYSLFNLYNPSNHFYSSHMLPYYRMPVQTHHPVKFSIKAFQDPVFTFYDLKAQGVLSFRTYISFHKNKLIVRKD